MAHIISEEFVDRIDPNVKLVGLGAGNYAGNDVNGCHGGWWIGLGCGFALGGSILGLGGADALAKLYEMVSDGFSARVTVFGGMDKGQAWPARVVYGFDGGDPGFSYREACCGVEVSDEGANTGQVVSI